MPLFRNINIPREPLTAADLFAGIGGVGLGFQQAGFRIVYANEIEKFCCETYRANLGEIDERDIRDVRSEEVPEFDVLLAGFPCQPFSRAGLRQGFADPTRGDLFFEIARILKDKQPDAFLLENVKFLQAHDERRTFAIMMDILENQLGYTVYHEVLNSKDFGLPQNRERIYIVGFKEPLEFSFPTPVANKTKIKDILEKNVEDKYFLSQRYYECLTRHKASHRARGHGFGFEVLDPDGVGNALTVGRMGRERNLIREKPRKGFYKEGMGKSAKNSLGSRMLSVRECARLQGFPESFIFPVSDTQAYKQLGNAVSIPVIKAIAVKMYKSLLKIGFGQALHLVPLKTALTKSNKIA